MKNDKLFTGLIIIGIGLIFLLDNLHVIDFHWGSVWRLWPVILVMVGVNLLFANTNSAVATAVRFLVLAAGLVFIIIRGTDPQYDNDNRWGFHFRDRHNNDRDNDNDDNDNDDNNGHHVERLSASSTFTENYTLTVKVAKLFISGGGTEYKIEDTDSSLFTANTEDVFGHYDLKRNDTDSVAVLTFQMRKKDKNWNWNSDGKKNEVRMKLNPAPVWDIDVQAGATEADFDLQKFKVRSFSFNGGAAAVEVKLGDKQAQTHVDMNSGAAAISIKIPRASGCHIESNGGLSSRDFKGFTKLSDRIYETPGYASAAKKITMKLSGGVSSFEVERY